MTSGKAFLGVLAGIAAGAVLGVLFAPDKGASTRKNIAKKGEDLADALDQKIDEKFNEMLKAMTGKVKTKEHSTSPANNKSELVG